MTGKMDSQTNQRRDGDGHKESDLVDGVEGGAYVVEGGAYLVDVVEGGACVVGGGAYFIDVLGGGAYGVEGGAYLIDVVGEEHMW